MLLKSAPALKLAQYLLGGLPGFRHLAGRSPFMYRNQYMGDMEFNIRFTLVFPGLKGSYRSPCR